MLIIKIKKVIKKTDISHGSQKERDLEANG